MILCAYGSLHRYVADRASKPFTFHNGISVRDFLVSIEVPLEDVKVVVVNHKPARPNHSITADDRIALFPQEYPFFADWKDYRAG